MDPYKIFITVVEAKNLSLAAKKLHRSPSAISKQISQLEHRLNSQLIDRSTRAVALTEAGKRYYRHCLKISRQIEEAETELADLSNSPRGTLFITLPRPIIFSDVMDELANFGEHYPEIHLDIDVNSDVLNFIDDRIDIAFRVGPIGDIPMIGRELFCLQPIACAAPSAVERHGMPETLDELMAFPIMLEKHIDAALVAKRILPGIKSLKLSPTHSSNCIITNLEMTKLGMGSTVVFEHMVRKELASGELIRLAPKITFDPIPVHMLYQSLTYQPKKIALFVEHFKQAFKDLGT